MKKQYLNPDLQVKPLSVIVSLRNCLFVPLSLTFCLKPDKRQMKVSLRLWEVELQERLFLFLSTFTTCSAITKLHETVVAAGLPLCDVWSYSLTQFAASSFAAGLPPFFFIIHAAVCLAEFMSRLAGTSSWVNPVIFWDCAQLSTCLHFYGTPEKPWKRLTWKTIAWKCSKHRFPGWVLLSAWQHFSRHSSEITQSNIIK